MKKWVVSGIVVLAIIVAAVGGYLLKSANTPATTLKASQTAVNKPEVASKPPTRAELLKLVNEQRAKVGVAPLKEDSRLDWSAQQKADDEVKYNYFGHFRNGVFIGQQFIDQTGISCRLDSENITANAKADNNPQEKGSYSTVGWTTDDNTAQTAVKSWTNSQPHYQAMVSSKYTLTGFGISGYEIVEHFCQP